MKISFITAALILILSSLAISQDCLQRAAEVKPTLSAATKKVYDANLVKAFEQFSRTGGDVESLIWLGRRLAYLGNYRDAIRTFTAAIAKFPGEPRLYRHRGHRYITRRCFDEAIADLERAAKLIKGKPDEVEPDGIPNAKNTPTSTLQSNIWYHLGLAYYLKGDFKNALRAYEKCEKVSNNNDMRVATVHWHYMTLRRLGRKNDAEKLLEPFKDKVEVIENDDYLKLIRLYRGEVIAETLMKELGGEAKTLGSASLGYGLGNWYFYNGETAKGLDVFRKITAGDQWASFGYIAAETELARKPRQ
jgi:tetratricopeptide (TPR) repeat protein